MNVYCWIEYSYYDGLLCFAQITGSLDPDSPILSASVWWLNSELHLDAEQESA